LLNFQQGRWKWGGQLEPVDIIKRGHFTARL
jgi:hypothetical protein